MRIVRWISILFLSLPLSAQEQMDILDIAGIQIYGEGFQDNLGTWLDGAGDVNGDGFDDIVLGTYDLDGIPGTDPTDFAYVIYGATELPAIIDLAEPYPGMTRIVELSGKVRVAGIGDFNGDGYDDVILGDNTSYLKVGVNAGEAFILFGTGEMPSEIDIPSASPAMVRVKGYAIYKNLGTSVCRVGDINGDGFDDAFLCDVSTSKFTVADAYLIYGGTDVPREIQTPDIGPYGVHIRNRMPRTGLHVSIAGPGDVNGDGFPDLLIGSDTEGWGQDYAFLIYGGTDLPPVIDTTALGDLGVRITHDPGPLFGHSVSGAGDVNGDGLMDFLIGEWAADAGGLNATGRAYLIYGATDFPPEIDVRMASNLVLAIDGVAEQQGFGMTMAALGDVNFDGFSDPLVGSSQTIKEPPLNILFGGYLPSYPSARSVHSFDRVILDSMAGGNALGSGAASVGDVNHDGYDDFIVGDRYTNAMDRFSAGTVYVIFNRPGLFQSLRQRADLNGDGEVDHEDLFLFGSQWQEKK